MNAPEPLQIRRPQIRAMTASDVDAVVALDRSSEGTPHWAAGDYLSCFENRGDSALRRVGLVAHWNQAFAGFAVARYVIASGGAEAELESIAVPRNMRGRGIGRALLGSVIDAAKLHGADRLELEVRASNSAAIRLYQRAGFAKTGRRRSYYRNPDEDAVLMSVKL